MPYEIDFLPVGDGCSGDALAIRYATDHGYEVMVVDGGTQASGEALVDHIRTFYQTTTIHHVVNTHPDNDHACGLRVLFESFNVQKLWLHLPWIHAERTKHMFQNAWEADRLKAAIKRDYPVIDELFELAKKNKTDVGLPFQGDHIGPFVVAAPSIQRYELLLPQFRGTPAANEPLLKSLGEWLTGLGKRAAQVIRKIIRESRELETLREGGVTSAENESSVVLYGDFPGDPKSVLLTADAGLMALDEAITYLYSSGIDMTRLGMVQMPHHGSRNNISPSILNRLLGTSLPEGQTRPVISIVSASLTDEDHPRQIVVNAFERRGVKVYPTHGQIKRYHFGMPERNWGVAQPMPFSPTVEEYD